MKELIEFECGTVIGCHRCNKSAHNISSHLDMSQSNVSSVIAKWKNCGIPAPQPQSVRPHKLQSEVAEC